MAYKGLFRVFAEMNVGIGLFQIVQKVQKVERTFKNQLLLTIVKWGGFAIVVYQTIFSTKGKYDVIALIGIVFLLIGMLSECTFAHTFFNNPICYALGAFSLPLYLTHYASKWITMYLNDMGIVEGFKRFAIYLVLAIVLSLAVLWLGNALKSFYANTRKRNLSV